jgi:aminobenzoyl-glutamate utilization protein B
MLLASKVMAGAAVDLFEKPEMIDMAKDELALRLGGQAYRSAIPDGVAPRPISKL